MRDRINVRRSASFVGMYIAPTIITPIHYFKAINTWVVRITKRNLNL